MKPALRLQNVSKRYGIGANPAGDFNITESAKRLAKGTLQKFRALVRPGNSGGSPSVLLRV